MTGAALVMKLAGFCPPLTENVTPTAIAPDTATVATAMVNTLWAFHFRLGGNSAKFMGGGGIAGARFRRLFEIEREENGPMSLLWREPELDGLELVDFVDLEHLDPLEPTEPDDVIVETIASTIISSASNRSCSSILRRTSSLSEEEIAMLLEIVPS
jgi:hypothetical protein